MFIYLLFRIFFHFDLKSYWYNLKSDRFEYIHLVSFSISTLFLEQMYRTKEKKKKEKASLQLLFKNLPNLATCEFHSLRPVRYCYDVDERHSRDIVSRKSDNTKKERREKKGSERKRGGRAKATLLRLWCIKWNVNIPSASAESFPPIESRNESIDTWPRFKMELEQFVSHFLSHISIRLPVANSCAINTMCPRVFPSIPLSSLFPPFFYSLPSSRWNERERLEISDPFFNAR